MEENSHLPIKSLVEFMDELDKKKASLPYNINVIDELHINENAHSRILHKLLEFRAPNGKYELLQSLIDYIKTAKKKFADLEITNPTITHEEARIDLWVRDENNAIIFENKVYNAVDQEAQLSRYIEKTNETYHDRSKIFVVYLPDVGDKDPDPQTWGPYKDEFESRYVKLSFRDDIRTWLRDYVLPNIRLKDTLLKSAVVQYLDFLDGLFSQRLNDKAMNEKKMQSLDKILGMNDEISMHGVKNIKEKVDSLITILENYKNRLAHAVRNELEKRIKNQLLSPEFDSLKYYEGEKGVGDVTQFGHYGGVRFEYKGTEFLLFIGYDNNWYCQVQTAQQGQNYNFENDMTEICGILTRKTKGKSIYKYCYEGFEEAYGVFLHVLNALCEQK